jgi:hypothetical protein
MFWNKKKLTAPAASLKREPLTNPANHKPLPQTDHPGYYLGFSTLAQQKYWDAATRDLIHKRMTEDVPFRFFTFDEIHTLRAVVGRILPQEDRTEAYRIDILPGIDKRLYEGRIEGYQYEDMPSDRDAYRLAARAFEQMAQEVYGMSFHHLPTLNQEQLLKSIHDAEPSGAKSLWKGMNVERFWTLLVTDCCTVYYAHPYAWDEVGYGGPAYPRGYMRLEEGEAEPWEVNEQRYVWDAPADTLSDREEAHGSGQEHQTHHGQAGTH